MQETTKEFTEMFNKLTEDPTEENHKEMKELCMDHSDATMELINESKSIIDNCFSNAKELFRTAISFTKKTYDYICNRELDYYKSE